MLTIQAISILSFMANATIVSAHGHVLKWTVNGVDHAGFTDHTTGIVACGGASPGTGVLTWDVDAGSTVTAHWDQWPDSHKGSVAEYMARCPGTTCNGVAADSLDWFKIDEANYAGGKWPTETVTATRAWSFKIPADLAAGPYLVRHDLLAMHSTGEPQVYPVCFQANLIGSGSAITADTVKFPAAYKINTDFETWSLYGGDQTLFVPPGPAVYGGGGGGAAPPAPAPVPSSSATVVIALSSAAPVAPSSVAPVVSSASAVPASSSVVAPAPTPTVTPDVPETDPEYPEEPVPAPSSSTYVASSSSAAPISTSSVSSPVVTPPTTGGSLGDPAPAIIKEGDKWVVNGSKYNFEADAKYNSCMAQMCKNWANGLPNAEVGPAFSLCDAQAATCFTGSKKREVINRYSKRGLPLLAEARHQSILRRALAAI